MRYYTEQKQKLVLRNRLSLNVKQHVRRGIAKPFLFTVQVLSYVFISLRSFLYVRSWM